MPASPRQFGFRLAALLTAASMAACAPAGPGPYQQQANSAAYACQQGIREACQDYQALAPAANAEAAQAQQNAVVGTALAAGVVGAVAGAAIAGSGRSRHRDRGYYHGRGDRRDYYRGDRRGYERGYYR